MAKQTFRWSPTYIKSKFEINNDALFAKIKHVYFTNEKILARPDLDQILYMLKVLDRKNMNISVQENVSMHPAADL